MSDRDELLKLIKDLAVVHGRVTLSSGQQADYYIDLRRITLHRQAAPLVGRVLRELTADWSYAAAGGLTLGADPVGTAILHASDGAVDAFVVRKAEKQHGMQQRIEGPSVAGRRVLVVEDVSTTGSQPADRGRGAARGRRRGRRGGADRRPGRRAGHRGCRPAVPRGVLAGRPRPRLASGAGADRTGAAASDDATPDLAVGVGPHPRPWPTEPRYDPELLEHGDRRNVSDRYRYWSVAGDRRRPRHPPARVRGGDRELAARREHRHRGPDGQRVPGPRGADRRAQAVEPARCDGDRPLPAPAAPAGDRRPGGAGRPSSGYPIVAVDNTARRAPDRDRRAAAQRAVPVRAGGSGADRRRPRPARR